MGGAEMMLARMVENLDPTRYRNVVISLRGEGTLGPRIRASGAALYDLGMSGMGQAVSAVRRLKAILRDEQVDVVQGWMYHGNVIAGIAGKRMSGLPVAWGLHASFLDPKQVPFVTTLLARRIGPLVPFLADHVISCSEAARQLHAGWGYPKDRMSVIPNGFDLTAFQPDPAARRALRLELELPEDAVVVGHVGRYHPQKDYETLMRAVARVRASRPDTHFVFIGKGVEWENSELANRVTACGERDNVHLLGPRSDIQMLHPAWDFFWLGSAFGEAFPLVVGEAMACEVPCVATDVGDSAELIGDTGKIAPPQDPGALAEALLALLGESASERAQRGRAARARIAENYAMSAILERYLDVYQRIMAA
ncbi:putative glycosyl transferase family protein [Magnetofaba australis IT-1]|uniref:Putative glycosyl transferase family protein n=2 Tax=Magnetofaba TaxID=1472292 RepID=A0A1Y2K6M4_9PROT|nr:putative glycosyl transferase family protein [Magnetofaba australis IT-1]